MRDVISQALMSSLILNRDYSTVAESVERQVTRYMRSLGVSENVRVSAEVDDEGDVTCDLILTKALSK